MAAANASEKLLKTLSGKLIDIVSKEMNDTETQRTIREKIVSPLLNIVFKELNRYVYGLFIVVFLTLLFSLMTFVVSMVFLFSMRVGLQKNAIQGHI